MFDWLNGWFARGWAGLNDLASAVRQAILNAVNQLIAAFLTWVSTATYVAMAAVYAWQAIIRFTIALYQFGGRLIFVRLPTLAAKSLADAVDYTERRIGDVVNFIYARVAEVVNLVRQLVGDLRSWAVAQITNIIQYIHDIVTLLNYVAKRVIALLTNPDALADWVAGSIISAVYRWAVGRADTLARWAFNGAITGALKFVDIVERIIADVFL